VRFTAWNQMVPSSFDEASTLAATGGGRLDLSDMAGRSHRTPAHALGDPAIAARISPSESPQNSKVLLT